NLWLHAAALAVVLALALYRPLLLLCVPVVVFSYWHRRRDLRLLRADSIGELRWGADDRWTWLLNSGQSARGRLLHATVLGRYFVLLRLRGEGRRFTTLTVPLAADSLAPDVHRRLRARLTLWRPDEDTHDAAALLQSSVSRLRAFVARR